MNTNILVFFLLGVVLFQVYEVFDKRNKIWCGFRRRDRTKIEKWAKDNQGRIDFDGGWYHVEPNRAMLMMKWLPLPMYVRCLDFRFDSSRALHPDTFDNVYTPEERKRLDASDDIAAYEKGGQEALSIKSKKGIMGTLPLIIGLIAVVIIGYMLYTQQHKIDMLGAGQNMIQGQMGQILQKLP